MKKLLLLLALFFTTAQAQQLIEYTVHHAPGGPSDRIARYLTKDLSPKEYIVINRPGAAGRIAAKHIMTTNSVLVATMAQIYVTNPINFKDLEYSPDRDLEAVATVAILPNLLACRSTLEITNFKQFLNTTKSLNFAVNGYGSAEHIATEALFVHTKGTHQIIPYANAGNKGVLDMLGGNIDCMFANFASIKPFVEDKRVTILFASHDLGVNVPTWNSYFKEPFPYQSYVALVVAKNMDSNVKKKIVADIDRVFKSPTYAKDVLDQGLIPSGSTEPWAVNAMHKANKALGRFIENAKLKTN
jgi:tripartite-type tricarboxylate transporter receptor subunit TctC